MESGVIVVVIATVDISALGDQELGNLCRSVKLGNSSLNLLNRFFSRNPRLEFSLPGCVHQERHPAVVLEVDGVDAALGRLHVDVLSHSINVVLGTLRDGVEDGMPS